MLLRGQVNLGMRQTQTKLPSGQGQENSGLTITKQLFEVTPERTSGQGIVDNGEDDEDGVNDGEGDEEAVKEIVCLQF